VFGLLRQLLESKNDMVQLNATHLVNVLASNPKLQVMIREKYKLDVMISDMMFFFNSEIWKDCAQDTMSKLQTPETVRLSMGQFFQTPISKDGIQKGILRQLYDKYDLDKKGLNPEVIKKSIGETNLKFSDANLELLIRRCDKNYDGRVGYNEFKSLALFVSSMKMLYQEADTNGDQSISLRELGALFTKLKYNFDDHLTEFFLKLFDEDKSGSIEYDEFLNLHLYLSDLSFQFHKADRNHSGSIDLEEFKSIINDLQLDKRHDPVKYFEKSAPNGKLGFRHFVKLVLRLKFGRSYTEGTAAPKIQDLISSGPK